MFDKRQPSMVEDTQQVADVILENIEEVNEAIKKLDASPLREDVFCNLVEYSSEWEVDADTVKEVLKALRELKSNVLR